MSSVRDPVGVLFADQLSMAACTLRTALEHMPTLTMVVEADLDRHDRSSKVALVFVHEADFPQTLTLISRWKVRLPNLRVLVAFQTLDRAALERLLEAGADAFIMPGSTPEDFCAALTDLAQGGTSIERSTNRTDSAAKGLGAGITRREMQILRLLSAGCSNKEVARQLDLSVRTIETHRLNLRRKTQTGRLHDLVALARVLELDAASYTPTAEVPQAA